MFNNNIAGTCLLALLMPCCFAASGWKAGAAKMDITPDAPVWMAGYGARTRPSEGIRQPLHVTALALEDESGRRALLITYDLVGIDGQWGSGVASRCGAELGLSRDRIWLNASHTHSGPVTGVDPPYYAPMNDVLIQQMHRYTAQVVEQSVKAAREAIADLQPASIEFGQGLAGLAVNRRRVANRSFPGPVDQDLPVLSIRGAGGKLRVIVFGYACHATSMGDYQISGDWPGYAKEEIEKAHPGAIALFVQGCGADSNPLPRYQGTDPALLPYSTALPRMYGKIISAAVDLVLGGSMSKVSGAFSSAFETVPLGIRTASRDQLKELLQSRVPAYRTAASRLLQTMERDGKLPGHFTYPVQVWRLGQTVKLIVLSGEVVVDYSLRFKGLYGWNDTWVAGYSNIVGPYIPSLRVLREGGYEGGDANRLLGGPFTEDVEEVITKKVKDLLDRTR